MAIAFRANSTATGTGVNGQGVTPTGTVDGDFQVAFLINSAVSANITVPAVGWDALASSPQTPADYRTWCYTRRFATGDTAPLWVFSTSTAWTMDIISYSGVDATTPVNASTGEISTPVNAIDLGPITPTVADCMLVGTASVEASGAVRTWTQSGAMTERNDEADGQLQRAVADELLSGGSGVGQTRTFTVSGSTQDMGGFLLALAPAGGASLDIADVYRRPIGANYRR